MTKNRNQNARKKSEKHNGNVFFGFNEFLENYKTLIEFTVAIAALIVLVATFWGVKVSRESLEFAQQEFYTTNIPTWKFEVDPTGDTIRIVSTNSDYIVQSAKIIYPDEKLNVPFMIDVVPPLHEWHVSFIKKLYKTHKQKS